MSLTTFGIAAAALCRRARSVVGSKTFRFSVIGSTRLCMAFLSPQSYPSVLIVVVVVVQWFFFLLGVWCSLPHGFGIKE